MSCRKETAGAAALIRDPKGDWHPYSGQTGLRKLYVAAYEAKRGGRGKFFVYGLPFDATGLIVIPPTACVLSKYTSINDVPVADLPQVIVLERSCRLVELGNKTGYICLHCGERTKERPS